MCHILVYCDIYIYTHFLKDITGLKHCNCLHGEVFRRSLQFQLFVIVSIVCNCILLTFFLGEAGERTTVHSHYNTSDNEN